MSRTQYAELFDVIGVTFGAGDGVNTFNLPNFTFRFPICQSNIGGQLAIGDVGGEELVTLVLDEIPPHSHTIPGPRHDNIYHGNPTRYSMYGWNTGYPTSTVGGGQGHNNMPPYLAVNFIICYSAGG